MIFNVSLHETITQLLTCTFCSLSKTFCKLDYFVTTEFEVSHIIEIVIFSLIFCEKYFSFKYERHFIEMCWWMHYNQKYYWDFKMFRRILCQVLFALLKFPAPDSVLATFETGEKNESEWKILFSEWELMTNPRPNPSLKENEKTMKIKDEMTGRYRTLLPLQFLYPLNSKYSISK